MENLDPSKLDIHSGTEIVSKKKAEYKFLGSGKRPHRGMFLYALDIENSYVYQVKIIKKKVLDITKKQEKGLSKATLNTKHPNIWKINHKNALKHFEKLYNRKFRFLKTN